MEPEKTVPNNTLPEQTAPKKWGKRVVVRWVGMLVIIGVAFGAGYFYRQEFAIGAGSGRLKIDKVNEQPPASQQTTLDMTTFWKVLDLVEQNYLDAKKISGEQLLYGAISGLVSAVGDPYTSFFTPEQNAGFKDSIEGLYDGIGAQLGFKGEQLVIVSPLDGSPAEKVGVRPGDLLLQVDGVATSGWSLAQAVSVIRGEAGSSVELTLLHEGGTDPVTISVNREQIKVPAVVLTWVKDAEGHETNIARLRVMRFGSDTIEEWQASVTGAKKAGAKGVVVDVRNNPGGYLNAAIYLASDFFKEGVVVKRQTNAQVTEYKVDHPCELCQMPTVVLINEGSASASEILAGALQARGRAKLVGVQSFGKGTVQEALELDGGAGIHITTARWLLPNDQNIHGEGLAPDVNIVTDQAVSLFDNGTEDPQLMRAAEMLK